MKSIRSVLLTATCLLALCSCVTTHPELPHAATLNDDVACGNELLVKVRLESGDELPFIVDTGSPITVFDKSFAAKLGKPVGKAVTLNFGARAESSVYAMPKIYLGSTRLMTGNYTVEMDLTEPYASLGIPHPMGILGMDCLQHYCIQLDFEERKLRFLNPNSLSVAELGKSFRLLFSNEGQSWKKMVRPMIRSRSLMDEKDTTLLVDSGYRMDGALEPSTLERAIKQQGSTTVLSVDKGRVWFSKCLWNGGVYTNLLLGAEGNVIGLGFLARHLVTLNFPKHKMYLKQLRVGPLTDETMKAAQAFLDDAKENGRLPGWSKDASGMFYLEPFPNYIQFDGRKSGAPSVYHYKVGRESGQGPWKLEKAWRTGATNQVLEEFAVP